MIYREFAPSPGARSLIDRFWMFSRRYNRPAVERVVPDGNIDFVVHATHRPTLTLPGRSFRKPAAFTGGQLVHGGRLAVDGDVVMFGVRFHAWSAPRFYRVPVGAVNDDRVSVHELVGHDLRDRYDELVNEVGAGNYAHATRVIEALAARWERPSTAAQRLLELAMRAQQAAGGGWSLSAASRELRVSERYLQRTFRDERGMTFKYFARLVRVSAAIRAHRSAATTHAPRLERSPARAPTLAALARIAGYYDQAHQARDFAAIVGCSPHQLFGEDNRYLTEIHRPRSGNPELVGEDG